MPPSALPSNSAARCFGRCARLGVPARTLGGAGAGRDAWLLRWSPGLSGVALGYLRWRRRCCRMWRRPGRALRSGGAGGAGAAVRVGAGGAGDGGGGNAGRGGAGALAGLAAAAAGERGRPRPGRWRPGGRGAVQALGGLALLVAGRAGAGAWGRAFGRVLPCWRGFLLGAALVLPAVLAAVLAVAAGRAQGVLAQWFWADARQQLPGLSLALDGAACWRWRRMWASARWWQLPRHLHRLAGSAAGVRALPDRRKPGAGRADARLAGAEGRGDPAHRLRRGDAAGPAGRGLRRGRPRHLPRPLALAVRHARCLGPGGARARGC